MQLASMDDSPATKADVSNLRNELQYYATKADLAHMETRLLIRLGSLVVAVGAAVVLIDRFLG